MHSSPRLLTLTLVAALVAAMLLASPAPAHAGPVFVTHNGAAFDLGGQPFRFGGTNNYYRTASNLTSTGAVLSWTASADGGGSGLAGYVVHREQGTTDPLLARPTTNSATLTGLTPNTQYQVYVRARDNAGNLSSPSTSVTFTTQPGAAGNRMSYNGNLAPDASTQIGFNGTFTTKVTAPSTFTLDGATCTSG